MSLGHESLQLGGGIREWFSLLVRKTHWSVHSFLSHLSLGAPCSGYHWLECRLGVRSLSLDVHMDR